MSIKTSLIALALVAALTIALAVGLGEPVTPPLAVCVSAAVIVLSLRGHRGALAAQLAAEGEAGRERTTKLGRRLQTKLDRLQKTRNSQFGKLERRLDQVAKREAALSEAHATTAAHVANIAATLHEQVELDARRDTANSMYRARVLRRLSHGIEQTDGRESETRHR